MARQKITVVSAHPDDVEIACAGSLRRWQLQGAEITSIVAVRPSVEDNRKRSDRIVWQELHTSYDISGWKCSVMKTDLHSNGRPNLVCNNITMTEMSKYISDCDLAILPSPEDSHQDHRSTYDLAFPLLKNRAREIWTMCHWPYRAWHRSQPRITIDISDHWDFKQQLLECYSSYLDYDAIENIRRDNMASGVKHGFKYAENFDLVSHCE
jgi:LmbE family N-acetylglucosaminyl deacetylase